MATTPVRDTTNRFLTLDRDALACVLGHLDAPSLANASASCKLFRDTTNSSALWRSLCVAERGSLARLPAGIDWRKMAATIFPPERSSSSVSDYTLLVDFTDLNGKPWIPIFAAVPALLAFILLFLDNGITWHLLNRPENKLTHGEAYNYDTIVIGITVLIVSVAIVTAAIVIITFTVAIINAIFLTTAVSITIVCVTISIGTVAVAHRASPAIT